MNAIISKIVKIFFPCFFTDLARIRATGEKTTWIRGDDVLMSGKNLFSLFLMKNCADEKNSVSSDIISVEIRSGK